MEASHDGRLCPAMVPPLLDIQPQHQFSPLSTLLHYTNHHHNVLFDPSSWEIFHPHTSHNHHCWIHPRGNLCFLRPWRHPHQPTCTRGNPSTSLTHPHLVGNSPPFIIENPQPMPMHHCWTQPIILYPLGNLYPSSV